MLAGHGYDGGEIAGAVASHSNQVVGHSNVFAPDGGTAATWPLVRDAVDRLFPTLPVVGHEPGDGLAATVRHDFEPVGPPGVRLHG
ncbi:hypothetical protein ACIQ6K_39995 [Streptomyces sp. NPDC096354]|uniref:hypothetical protein n=1 Tax=Streptomyces sp. NPDC096354 TaxID=3366088 RepID=UPI00380EBD4F